MPRLIPPLSNVKLLMWSRIDNPQEVTSACRSSTSQAFSLSDGRILPPSRLTETLYDPNIRLEVIHHFPGPLEGVIAFLYSSDNHDEGIMVRMNDGLWTPLRLDAKGRSLETWQRASVGTIRNFSVLYTGDLQNGPL